jgi:hypothetical protein
MTARTKKQRPTADALLVFAATFFLAGLQARGSDTVEYRGETFDPDDFRVSYAYAAVMGTGTYKIDGRNITMLRAPFSLTQREATDDKFGMKWFLPVSIGYDAVTDNNWLDLVFDEDLVTLTAMPGFQAHLPLDDTWSIKPFGRLGATRDFTLEETIILGQVGLTSLGTWIMKDGAELRWGAGAQLVGEYQIDAATSNGFSVLETGVDYRKYTGFQVLKHKIDAGVYYRYQYFLPVWDASESPVRDSDVNYIQEFGVSVGLQKPRKILGIRISRVRLGYQQGSNLRGWTLGTEFPF